MLLEDAHSTPQYGRPAEIEEASNYYCIHRLANVVVSISLKVGVSPNAISLAGLLCGLAAAYCYYHLPQPQYVLAGLMLMIGWHILDGADGRLARATGQASAFGRIIDGVCDHLVFGAVYIVFALHLMETGRGLSSWWLVLAASLSHAVQAAGYEERRQKYQRRLKQLDRGQMQGGLLQVRGRKSLLATIYDFAQKLVSGGDYGLDEVLAAQKKDDARAIIRGTAPMVRAWAILNANNRTFLIFIFAYMGKPALYFMFEITVFNAVMLALLFAERYQESSLAARLKASPDP